MNSNKEAKIPTKFWRSYLMGLLTLSLKFAKKDVKVVQEYEKVKLLLLKQ